MSARAKKKFKIGLALPALTAVALSLAAFHFWPDRMNQFLDPALLWRRVLWPLARGLGFMALGLAVAIVIESMGWTVRLGRLAAPLTRRARLPESAAASFVTALASGPAANAMLSEALEKKEITPRALAVANLLNGSWPTFITHLPSTLVVAASLAGRAGLAYAVLMFCAATLRLFGAALLGRLILPPLPDSAVLRAAGPEKKNFRDTLPVLKSRLTRRLKTLFIVAGPIFYLTSLAASLGFFEYLRQATAAHLSDFFLPVEAAALVVFSLAAEFTSGFAAAGALLNSASVTFAEATAALVLGNIIATPIRILRWQLAPFLGFFQLRLGLILIFCNQAFRTASLAAVLYLFWRLFS